MMTKKLNDNFPFAQVIQYLEDGTVQVYEIEDLHIGTEDDPLTTIRLTGRSEVITKEK